jgi:hypothetical protein
MRLILTGIISVIIRDMIKFYNSKNYALITGLILFLFGVVGFAFRGGFNIADKYLILSLILGAWGIYCAFN